MLRKIKNLLVVSLFGACLFAVPAPAYAQTDAECRESGSADAIERCFTQRQTTINATIRERCGEPSASVGYERCADRTRSSILTGDNDFDGTPDSVEEEADSTRGGNPDADCTGRDEQGNKVPIDKENCGIISYIVTITNALSAIVGIVVVIMIAVGGLRYATSGDDPQAIAAAKEHIKNAIFALVVYFFGFALLQWLIPGGMF